MFGRRGRRLPSLLAIPLMLGTLAAPPTLFAEQDEPRWRQPATRWLERDRRPGVPHVPSLIARIEAIPPEPEVLLMVGSATAAQWNMPKWFSDFRTANVGFGGSYITDVTHFVDDLILPYAPSTVLMYMGDNDLNAGKPVEQTVTDVQAFVAKVRETLPQTQFVFVSIRPSIARWDTWPQMEQANTLINRWIDADPNLHYVDIASVTIGSNGRPRPELFVEDDLHLTQLGFLDWSHVTKPVVYEAQARYRELKGCDRWGCGALR